MRIDIRPLQVRRVIVHDVPSRTASGYGQGVTYSKVESDLSQQSSNYFRQRIIGSLETAGFDVRFAAPTSSPVPDLLSTYLTRQKDTDFVTMSQELARHLYESQTGVNSPGMLCVVEIRIDTIRGLAILKLNREGAVRIEPIDHHGNPTYDLQLIRDLILSERNKVFKAGLFVVEPASDSSSEVSGRVSDNQRGYAPATQVADFFLKRFLGCELIESAQSITKRFFDVTEDWISTISDPELKAQYEAALLSELNNERVTVDPLNFAETNLRSEHRQDFTEWLAENEIADRVFDKDTHLIRSRLRRISIDFESGVGVSLPPDAMEKGYVRLSEASNAQTRMEIVDRLRNLRGR